MKLLAAGDLHLGARPDLGRRPGERLAEQEQVWDWILERAREHGVDAVLFAGDAFEHRKPDPETLLAFERPLVRHRDKGGASVLAIPGNHDLSSLDGGCALDVFHEAGLIELVREPRVVAVGGGRVACLPWAPVARLAARWDGPRNELNEHVASLLLDVARDLYRRTLAEPDGKAVVGAVGAEIASSGSASGPILLMTHFAISGTSLPSGLDVGELREPVLDQDELLAVGFDAIVAGHIHRPQSLGEWAGVYVGSPMPLSFGEADGCERGPWLFEFAPGKGGIEQVAAPSRRFVNLSGLPHADYPPDVADAFVKLRLDLSEDEARSFDANLWRERLMDEGAYRVFVDVQVDRETRARDASVDDTLDEREALARWLEANQVDPELAARVLVRAATYLDGGTAEPTLGEPMAAVA